MKTRIIIATCALVLISCDKRDPEHDSKLSQLEKQATEAVERQRLLEAELAEQKILAERDAIERERTMIEQERIAMEELRDAENAAALADLERRQAELMERDRKISDVQRELDDRENKLTGLESELSERELDLAGREPLDALPPVQKNYVSGPTGDFSNFYEPLTPYGSWFQTSDYGYVYQPTIVRDSTWRPYTRGRWAFTDHGWTWASSEPFGWACYHYGRWALLRNVGWVWIPGNQWAPAWVSWRESPGHIGWAPLPPETLAWHSNSWDSNVDIRFGIDSTWFSFVSYRNFGNDIYSHCLPYSQNVVIYQSTTTVTHYVIRDRIVYCGGPRYRNVCDRIGRRFPIHRLRQDYSPDFGRGGRRLHSQFSGNELRVVAPRMDAEWNPALRPSRISRDLGNVVVNRTNELPEDVRKQFRERRQEDDTKAARWVANTGGREAFENDRKSRLEKNREDVVKNESLRSVDREPRSETNNKLGRPQPPAVKETPNDPSDTRKRPNDRESRRPNSEKPTISEPEIPAVPGKRNPPISDPEIPAIPGKKNPSISDPEIPAIPGKRNPPISDPEIPVIPGKRNPPIADPRSNKDQNRNDQSNRLPPIPPSTENRLGENLQGEPSTRLPQNRDTDSKNEIDKQVARDLRQQQEAVREERLRMDRDLKLQQEQQAELARQQQLDANKARQKEEQLEQGQRQQQERQEKLKQQLEQDKRAREQKEQGEKLRELQNKQELDRKEQQERLRAQQEQREQAREQQEKLREQEAQQEQARKQQAETQLRLKQQQEQLRAQQEQQEKMRAQQEQQERLRAQQEQQERARQQQEEAQRRAQEQQGKIRAQQEQQERVRQQQEEAQRRAQEQQGKIRAQQEQQERARQQQEEAQRRAQEQQEKMRGQQEQQERARQQQEEAQRRMQEQQERARQQQEESQRRMEEQQRGQQEQQERARQQQEEAQRWIQEKRR